MPDKSKIRKVWDSMQDRIRGKTLDGCGKARWKGLECGWAGFHEFKAWAYANGYVEGLSPDRIDSDKGYVPGNVQWITIDANRNKARNMHKPECQCFWCRRKGVDTSMQDASF